MTIHPELNSISRSPLRLGLPRVQSIWIIRGFLLIPLVLAWFALSPTAQAAPGTNTAYGTQALQSNKGVNDTAFGYQALKNNDTGAGNTATGFQALFNNTKGDTNTATGGLALFSNTLGLSNVANGWQALYSNTIASEGTAVGYQALYKNVGSNTPDPTGYFPGNQNTALGYQALYTNNYGFRNIAIGVNALFSNQNGYINTAVGDDAMYSNISGIRNVAFGNATLNSNTKGNWNTAIGHSALPSNIEGNNNTAIGRLAMFSNTTISGLSGHNNAALGSLALSNNTTGSGNIALGFSAGDNLDTGDNNINIGNEGNAGEGNTIRIGTEGTQTATFIAGIYAATTSDAGSTIPVYVDMNGNLGTAASSERFKTAIKPMDKTSEAILALKPVTFHYKNDSKGIPQFGLVAEDVAKVNPVLVVRDAEGKVYTVRYEAVNAMLLNEFLKEHRKNEEQEATIARQQEQIEALAAGLQKVSAQLEVNKFATGRIRGGGPAPQLVDNDK